MSMYYVYRLRSRSHPAKTFIGTSRNVKKRVALHNTGKVKATCGHLPWALTFYAAFSRKQRAHEFEDYLHTTEGRAFAEKHLWQPVPDPDHSS